MPNPAINPFNYNVDNFDSGILGPISDTNFRNYLLSHNLPVVNSVISGVLGGNPWQDLGTEYDVSQSNPNVVDVPNLQDVAQIPSLYNNLTNPRQVNLTNNLQNLNPEVQNILGQTTPIQAGLGQDATSLFNPNTANLDLPSPEDVAQIASDINNFTTPRYDNLDKNPTPQDLVTWNPIEFAAIYNQYSGDYDTSYGVPQTLRIGYVGNTEEWVNQSGIITTTNEIREDELFSPANNRYGPNEMVAYTYDPAPGSYELVSPNTGLIQYNPGVQGDFRDQLLSRSLGVGIIPFSTLGSGINYKPDGTNISELDTIARKRRGVELANRLKINFIDDTVGAINTSPLGLLAGGNLIERDYTITVPKTKTGKAAQFLANLAGFNLPTSIIPDAAFQQSTNQQVDVPDDLLDYTGNGQKSLLFDALYINKYGPTLGGAYKQPTTGEVKKNLAGAGQPPNTRNYLSEPPQPPTEPRNKSLVDTLNDKIDGLLRSQQAPTIPYEGDKPTINDDQYGGFYGKFEPFESVGRSFSEKNGFGNEEGLLEATDYNKPSTTYNGTPVEQYTSTDQTGTVDETIDWRKRNRNPFKKGILKYTQELVNNSTLRSATGYIGYFDSAESLGNKEYKQDIDKNGHLTGVGSPTQKPTLPSKGNTVRNYEVYNPSDGFTRNGPGDDTGGEFYCRSWSSRRKYHAYYNLIRKDGNWWRNAETRAVGADGPMMTMNWAEGGGVGIPKIAWTQEDNIRATGNQVVTGLDVMSKLNALEGMMVPYMFSIENLAWKNAPQYIKLPPCERGPNGGRIMWFPPYDIDFSDNTSINWDTTNFIGRGEPIYTYNHTERSGNLSFKIVVDHPSVLNDLRERFKNTLLDDGYQAFFAGCDGGIKELFANYLPSESVPFDEDKTTFTPTQPTQSGTPPGPITIYFENCRCDCLNDGFDYRSPKGIGRAVDLTEYEVTNLTIAGNPAGVTFASCDPGLAISGVTVDVIVTTREPLNKGKEVDIDKLVDFLLTEDGKNYKVKLTSSTSPSNPNDKFNPQLAKDRGSNTWQYIVSKLISKEQDNGTKFTKGVPEGTEVYYKKEIELQNNPERWEFVSEPKTGKPGCTPKCPSAFTPNLLVCCDGDPCDPNLQSGQANSEADKKDRFVKIQLEYNPTFQQEILTTINKENEKVFLDKQKEENLKREADARKAAQFFVNECDYFMELKKEDPFIYSSLREKLKNFHPAFHAITPEGFNSRLTFLQQCTRQGPQILDSDQPQNMVFGRPPICVLRIGDFYHTKIVIDSVNFTFDPLQWDLNPEGIGVQPMIAKVDMGFKFIGGSSLGGPIKQLQNAVSYNFFANTGIYRPYELVEDIISKRKYVYGAFLSPDEEDKAYVEVLKSLENKTSTESNPTTNANTTDAEMTTEEKDKIDAANEAANTGIQNENKIGEITFLRVEDNNGFPSVSFMNINTTAKKDETYRAEIRFISEYEYPIKIEDMNLIAILPEESEDIIADLLEGEVEGNSFIVKPNEPLYLSFNIYPEYFFRENPAFSKVQDPFKVRFNYSVSKHPTQLFYGEKKEAPELTIQLYFYPYPADCGEVASGCVQY